MISDSWIQLEALLEDYMGSEVDREMANAIKALAKGYAHDFADAAVAEARAPLVEALPDPQKLRVLADWIERYMRFFGVEAPDEEVQR